MRYPSFLSKNATIGIIAPSFGVSGFPYEDRYQAAKEKFISLGYKIKECKYLYGITNGQSSTPENRANDFMNMYLDDEVDFIISVAGGEIMMEILPYIDFIKIKNAKPKYVLGYSDNTNLTFTLPVFCDVAAFYGSTFGSFGMRKWEQSLSECYEIISGKLSQQNSYEKYEKVDFTRVNEDPLAGYQLDTEVQYHSLSKEDVDISGRLIGGCLDVLTVLCGTPFGKIDDFLEKYKEDGFIWYLESCDLNVLSQLRSLWQLKQNGWFKYCKGIIYGRAMNEEELFDINTEYLLKEALGDLNIPVVYGADFGHVPPSWTIVSGAIGNFKYQNGKAKIKYLFD